MCPTNWLIIGDPIGGSPIRSPYIVTMWKVVFTNKSRKLGWIWMKLGRWGWGGLKRLSLARFQRNCTMGFGESAKKWVTEVLFFCKVDDASLLPLSLNRFPPNFTWTRVQVVARDTWFHIPEKFPLRSQISRKKSSFRVLKGTLFVPSLRVTGNVLRRPDCFHPLVDIPQTYPLQVTFAEGCTVFQLSTSERLPSPQYQQWWNLDAYISFKHTCQGAPRSDRRFALVHYSTFSSF